MALVATRIGAGRRFWPAVRTAHAWAGLGACLLLAVLALTGALLVFEEPLLRATVPGADVAPVTAPVELALAVEAAERTFGADGVRSLVFGSERFALHEVRLADGGGAWLDPRTHAVVERWTEHGRIGEWLFALHHELLLGARGRTIAGVVGVVGLLLVVTGVVYWARLRFAGARAWPRTTGARELDAAHRTWGLAAAVPLAVLLATGAGVALPDVAKPLLAAITGTTAAEPRPPRPAEHDSGPVNWRAGLAAAQARFPPARLRLVVWPRDGSAPLVRLRQRDEWHANGRTMVWFEPGSGAALGTRDALAAPRAARAYDLLWPLHASRVGGLAWQSCAFAAGMALAGLSVLGALAYVQRLRR